MVIIHPTSSSDEVNVAQPGSNGIGCSIVPTGNRFTCFVPHGFLYSGVRNMYMYKDLSVRYNSVVNTNGIASREGVSLRFL